MFIFQLDWFMPWVTAQQGDSGMRASAEDGICKLSVSKGPHHNHSFLLLCVLDYSSFYVGPFISPKFSFLTVAEM